MSVKRVSCAIFAICLLGFDLASAATLGTDNTTAAPYSDGWQNGDNGSTSANAAFQAWSLSSVGNAGFFLQDSTTLNSNHSGANINSGGNAFGMYGGPGAGSSNHSDASRAFSSTLAVGQQFSLDIAANYRNGSKGVDAYVNGSGTDGAGHVFTFNIGGDKYTVSNASSGNGDIMNGAYNANTKFSITFLQSGTNSGTWSVTRSGGTTSFNSGSYSGVLAGFHLYESGTDGGDPNNLFANNFAIAASDTTPELSSLTAFAMGTGSLTFLRRRRVAADAVACD